MPLEDFLGVLRSVKAAGLDSHKIMVVVTGGEPLLRPDIEQVGRAIRERGLRWGMGSNGWFYDEGMHARQMAAGLSALTVSLDGL